MSFDMPRDEPANQQEWDEYEAKRQADSLRVDYLLNFQKWKALEQGHLPNTLADFTVIGDMWHWLEKAFAAGAQTESWRQVQFERTLNHLAKQLQSMRLPQLRSKLTRFANYIDNAKLIVGLEADPNDADGDWHLKEAWRLVNNLARERDPNGDDDED